MEREIQEQIAQSLVAMGMPVLDAATVARSCVEAAKEESRKAGPQRLPEKAGAALLQNERKNANIARELQRKRLEGVTDDDIRWYWNMQDLERRAMEQMYQAILYATWKSALEGGRGDKEAAAYARKFHVYWGDPGDMRMTSGDDRPLPIELMKRENAWFEEQMRVNPEELQLRLERSSSYNAVIRAEIRAGRL
ncbi:MAG: hypothetical protein ACHQ9S_22745 [Candidatus Binatia bacterium]